MFTITLKELSIEKILLEAWPKSINILQRERKKTMRMMLGKKQISESQCKQLFATLTTPKEEEGDHFWYPGRNKVREEHKDIKDNHSWNDENKGETVYSEPAKNAHSLKIYYL